jgi:hypothetical protein
VSISEGYSLQTAYKGKPKHVVVIFEISFRYIFYTIHKLVLGSQLHTFLNIPYHHSTIAKSGNQARQKLTALILKQINNKDSNCNSCEGPDWQLAADWTVRGSNCGRVKTFSFLQTGFGVHPASYTTGTGG